ncbi:MAG: hypothetical protein KH100_01035 [Dysgonomonas mossii]|uniref:hypothetical protein n=1 Tax=Dysgonomonas mossii TaxID=163665 RepID=UPI001D578333|nr:hypothetical protein [Dysgonomonas mossii]MBS5795241.1 hypothetical protein [Dysgonomonas mossii]MBS7109769.1 hypothetical protein [Dysgonomonas mossii]
MERLKSILADKVLDLSSGNGEEVKTKIEKIQRFRDFANALKSFMIKYPAIEDELISMVESGDFDTKVASSRVDTIIRLADTERAQAGKFTPQIVEPTSAENQLPLDENEESAVEDSYINPDDIPMEIYEGEEETLVQTEDVDFEEIESISEEVEKGYVPFEDVKSEEHVDIDGSRESEEDDTLDISEEEKVAKRKQTIRRVLQIVGIILAVIALIFIIKFIMTHWQTVLIVLGILVALGILIFWLKRKR